MRAQWPVCGLISIISAAVGVALPAQLLAQPVNLAQAVTAGQPGRTVTLPTIANPTSGLQVIFDAHWPQTEGYWPLRVSVQSVSGPAAADRVLTMEIAPRYGYSSKVSFLLELAEGETVSETTVLIPVVNNPFAYGVDVWEDGKRIKELSTSNLQNVFSRTYGNSGNTTHVLVIGNDQSVGTVVSGLAQTSGAGPIGPVDFDIRSPDGLPSRWIDYSGLDLVCLSAPDVETLATRQPEVWRAIRDWTSSGGNLLVYNVGQQWEQLTKLEEFLRIYIPPGADESDPPAKRGWQTADSASYQNWLAMKGQSPQVVRQGQWPNAMGAQAIPAIPAPAPVRSGSGPAPEFLWRELGRGVVLALPDAGPTGVASSEWGYYLTSVGLDRLNWTQRHGFALGQYNADFWNLMIPGVGLPPVTGFQILITLFVLLIGPANFYVLRKYGQIKLLLVTVPVSAVLVTVMLLGYAVVADGLGVRARVRSFTVLDQTTGETVTWSRQSYYAGLSPSDALTFRDDTVIYPLESEQQYRRRNGRSRNWHWDEAGQHLSGWLPARTPTQIIAVTVRDTKRGLAVTDSGGKPQVVNNLGAEIEHLILVDAAGQHHYASNLKLGGGAVELAPISQVDARRQLREIYDENSPQYLVGLASMGPSIAQSGGNRAGYTTQSNGLLERGFSDPNALGPRKYLAIMRSSPEVTLGLESAREESSFHVISGRW